MEVNQELNEKIQELQAIERKLQSFSMEKQTMQIEVNEINNAISELDKSGDEVYRIIGGLMIRSNKGRLSKELGEKKKVLEMRINSVEKQEKPNEEREEKLRKEINDKIAGKKNQN
jgi:prefoldin beta subunit